MSSDPLATRPRRFVSITRTAHPSGDGYFLDAIADDGTAWYCLFRPSFSYNDLSWMQHRALPPIN